MIRFHQVNHYYNCKLLYVCVPCTVYIKQYSHFFQVITVFLVKKQVIIVLTINDKADKKTINDKTCIENAYVLFDLNLQILYRCCLRRDAASPPFARNQNYVVYLLQSKL